MRGLSPVAASGGHSSSRCAGLSYCRAQAPDAQTQQLWLTGPVAPRHVGSSQTRARTRVPCTGRQTPNHCATREALHLIYFEVTHFEPQIRRSIYEREELETRHLKDFCFVKLDTDAFLQWWFFYPITLNL